MKDLLETIALPLLPDIGQQHSKELIAYFGGAAEAMRASQEDWLDIPGLSAEQVDRIFARKDGALHRAEREVEFIEKHGIQVHYYEDDDYSERLRQCPDCPLVLYTKGRVDLNKGRFVSVVGTRMPTDRGRITCHDIVKDLAAKVPDVTIVSGLAYGIDVTAHMAAIEAHVPTIIVPGHGLDRIYPNTHRKVAVDALSNGGIATEYMSENEPLAPHFVARNRIIAGLSDATVVVESRSKGGSLITANMAVDYSRELFAVPGRPGDVQSAGCNALIRDNKAGLIESADDLIQAMGWQALPDKKVIQTTLNDLFVDLKPEEEKVLQLLRLREEGLHVNLVVMELRQPYQWVLNLMFQMELKGLVRSLPGGLYRALK